MKKDKRALLASRLQRFIPDLLPVKGICRDCKKEFEGLPIKTSVGREGKIKYLPPVACSVCREKFSKMNRELNNAFKKLL